MPDVKAVPCDLSPLAPPATRGMDLERCLGELQGSLSVLGTPLSAFPHASAPYPTLEIPPPYNNNNPPLLSNLGVRYCSPSSGPPSAKHPHDAPPCPAQGHYGQGYLPQGYASSAGSRLYHSLENLHWATAVSDPTGCALGAPYRSVDSELILHYTSSSHWCNGPGVGTQVYGVAPGPDGLACCQRRGPPRKDLPAIPQWLLPSAVEDYGLNGNIRKGLREKLRLQSTRVAEPHKPMRPHAPPGHAAPPPSLPSDHDPGAGAHLGPARGQGGICARRITSPEEIKQEVLRRLQLRRQRSTPNLALASSCPEPGGVSTSLTSEPVSSCASFLSTTEQARRRPPVGRLHIPTFEEFKKMRQRENQQNQDAPTAPASGRSGGDGDERGQGEGESMGAGEQAAAQAEMENGSPAEVHSAADAQNRDPSLGTAADPRAGPICTSPAPRSPLPSLAAPSDPSRAVQPAGPGAPDAMALPFPPLREGVEGPSSCCPGILLDGSELSSYGATISRMRDGLLGSALDLFKKSCSAEIAESPVRLSHDQGDGADITASQPAGQSAAVSMTTSARETEASVECSTGEGGEREEPTECHPGAGCRRSSSDAAYELSASVKAERECRLRPHFSDPMPADAAKRKQLEMKMAAVARLHSQRRDRENGPVLVRGRSEPRGGERGDRPGGGGGRTGRAGQHRWSTVSTLSADSGVVGGLSDDREDEDEPHRARRCAGGGRRGAEVERADSGIGSGLARGWKRPTATLASWETHRPCLDCGQQDDDGGGGRAEPMCERCSKLRTERKEAILEFLNTECSYGEDLRIIREEFYCPMQSAGLLTAEQLTVVFSNVQELMEVNDRFTEHLQDSIDHALDQGDEDLQTVCIGEIFLEFVNMLPAFQTYCLQQCSSVNMLNTLEKEKELLRIFLDVSQNDNTALRRMNLRSFLMAPLQRVTKYPLLLSRISKATGENHLDRGRLHEAKSRVESHLEHINMRSKQEGTASWSLRSFRRDSRKTRRAVDIELREVSLRAVGWARDGTRFVMEGPLQLSQPADGQWVKKGSRSLKFQNVQGLLLVRTQPGGEALAPAEGGQKGALLQEEDAAETVRDGALVLIKDKGSGKFTVLREPVRLGNCVVSSEPDCEDTFEILDIRREAFVFRAADKSRTQQWYRQIKRYAGDLGPWRKRRNALPNIMISTTQSRS